MAKQKMELSQARSIAAEIIEILEPYCEKIAVAGSIRRGKPEVGDIEIVAIPKAVVRPNLLGENVVIGYEIARGIDDLLEMGGQKIKRGAKYAQIATHWGINLDLFIVLPPAEWGVIFMIRTGSGNYSHHMVTQRNKGGALPSYCNVKNGAVWCNGEIIPMPREIDFYEKLSIPYMKPEQRGW